MSRGQGQNIKQTQLGDKGNINLQTHLEIVLFGATFVPEIIVHGDN